jgi:ribosomal protein S18 acetylase RimI-like enzyme
MSSFEIRPAISNDLPRLMALDHSSLSDYVWQLEIHREPNQITASFREVRLPRSVVVKYPRNPLALAEEWTRYDAILVSVQENDPVGYICLKEEHAAAITRVTDIAVAADWRRKGAGTALLMAGQVRALEKGAHRLILEIQSKNQGGIRLARKLGYEFCGYNDQYYPTQDVALFFGRALK